MGTEIKEVIDEAIFILKDLDFDILTLIDAIPMVKITDVNNGAILFAKMMKL